MELFCFTHAVEMNVQCVNFVFFLFSRKGRKQTPVFEEVKYRSLTVSTAITYKVSDSVFRLSMHMMLSMHKKQNYDRKAYSYKVSKEFYSISDKILLISHKDGR